MDENNIPNIAYHRKCRSLFTMKRDLETIKRKREEAVVGEFNPQRGSVGDHPHKGGYMSLYAFFVIKLNS